MPKAPKPLSVSTFVRRKLKLRGQTMHNGRGMYECYVDGVDQSDLLDKLRTGLSNWKSEGHVATIQEDDRGITATFGAEFDKNYNRLFIRRPRGMTVGGNYSVFYVTF